MADSVDFAGIEKIRASLAHEQVHANTALPLPLPLPVQGRPR